MCFSLLGQDKVRQHKDHSKLTKQNPLARLSLSEAQEQRREQNKVCVLLNTVIASMYSYVMKYVGVVLRWDW